VRKKVYIYPNSSRDKIGIFNPYVNDVVETFEKHYSFVNVDNPSRTGIFDIIKYVNKIDLVFFHWVEKVPDMEIGKLQSIFLILLFPILRMFKVKVVWTMHNKLAHSKDNLYLKKLLFKKLIKNADFIITHSSEGIKYGESIVAGSSKKIHYLPHPIKNRSISQTFEPVYDILIWGMISPYKGIHNFLEYLEEKGLEKKYKIMIVGRVPDKAYYEKLKKYKSINVIIENKFIEDDLLVELIAKSRIILFTYSKSSILSSGVLMDSLGYGANIIGPHVGAFADHEQEGIINTFKDYDEMIVKIDAELEKAVAGLNNKHQSFLDDNSWEAFAANISTSLK